MSTVSIIKKGRFQGDNMEEKEMDPMGITRIVKISIYHSVDLYGLEVYFECNGTTQCTDLWGGKYGQRTEVILETNEYITSVNGYVDYYRGDYYCCFVRSLMLKTNLKVYGPYGLEHGKSFKYPAPLGGQIIGFHAYYRKDQEVNALGVYIRQSNGTIIKEGPFLGRGWIVRHMHPTGITRIVKISIYHSDKIDGLTVYFERNGITQCTDRWGRDGGKLTEINLKTNEYIKSVKGYPKDFLNGILRSLVLETNLDVYGPYGKEEGKPFEHTSLYGQIIGFFARVGINYVSCVGVYIKGPISKSVLCGGSGGSTRDMDPTFSASPIDKVRIRHGDTIDALSVCYKFTSHITTESTPLWGGETGALTEIDLEYDEYITAVRGYVGYFGDIFIVRSLQLVTNKKTYGPYGEEEGTPFELVGLGGRIIGFHGRSGAYLDAIGVYVQWPEEEEDENKYYLQCSEEEEEEDKYYLQVSEEEEGR